MASGNPNCYHRGNFVCWKSAAGGERNVKECVRAFSADAIACKAARQRFCQVHGTRICSGGIRVCSNDDCPSGGNPGDLGKEYLKTFINDEGQGLDALLDDLSGRDTTFVNVRDSGRDILSSDIPTIEGSERSSGGFFDSKWFIPAIAVALGIGFVFLSANKDKIRRFVPRKRR